MMWRSDSIIQATTGAFQGAAFEASGVAIDSRKLQSGMLFVALKGDRVDGHDYVKEALARGAVAALVHKTPPGVKSDAPLIVVNDTYKALVDLAIAARRLRRAKIIAVTGSVGKTGTKEAIRIAAGSVGAAYATEGNLNNHIGLPLSLANLPPQAQLGIFELGMNHTGEISFLTRILRPDIAVITNVEAVHLEFFPHIDAIADAKAEIMEGMKEDGILILNRDNRFYEHLAMRAGEHGIRRILTFGAHAEAQCRLVNYTLRDLGSEVEASIGGTPIVYRLGTIGRHWAMTSLAALAAVTSAGIDLADAAAALAHFHELDGRGRIHRVLLKQDKPILLIDDCYNASPSSMHAAFAKLAELKAGLGTGRTIAVLGDMLELGVASVELHKELLFVLLQYGVDKIYASGLLMKHLYEILPPSMRGAYAKNATDLAPKIAAALQAQDVILIKGSRGSRMDIVRDAILASSPHTLKETADAL